MPFQTSKTGSSLLLMLLSSGIGKFASLISQLVLGWLLTKEDFGLYALALSVSSSAYMLRNGGAQQILIQRGDEYSELAPKIIRFSLIFNLAAFSVLQIIAPISAEVYHSSKLAIMISIIGIAMIMATPNAIYRSKLLIDHRFKAVSSLDLTSNIVRQGSTILLALLSFGYMAFIWPIVIESLFIWFMSYYYVGKLPKKSEFTKKDFKILFGDAKWIMLGALAVALGANGQYFVIGLFESTENLGIYFFGFQLVLSLTTIFTYTMETIFFPVMAKMKNNEQQLRCTYLSSMAAILIFGIPLSIVVSLLVSDIIVLLWHNKWNDSISIAQYLILSIPALMVFSLNRSVLEAKGAWGKRLLALGFFALFDMVVVGIVAWQSNNSSLATVALASCVYRTVFVFVQSILVCRIISLKLRCIFKIIFSSVLLAGLSTLLAHMVFNELNKCFSINNYRDYLLSIAFIGFFSFLILAGERKTIQLIRTL